MLVRCGKADLVCDVPLKSCSNLYIVGKENYKAAVIEDHQNMMCCVLNFNTFKVSSGY